jgi:hypothetical protein
MPEKNYTIMLNRLMEIKSGCKLLKGYLPLQKIIQIDSIDHKILTLDNLNNEIELLETKLNDKRQKRMKLIKGLSEKHGINGIIRLSRQVVNYVGAFGYEYNNQHLMLKKLIVKMQPKGSNGNGHSHNGHSYNGIKQSYASITHAAEEFYNILKDIPVYNPADTSISKSSYEAKLSEIKELSSSITDLYDELKPLIQKRYTEYYSKTNGVRKIVSEVKKYIRGNWGLNSNQYNSIKDIKI